MEQNAYRVIHQLSPEEQTQLLGLYQKEWWCKNRTLKDVEIILQGSSFIIGILENPSEKLIAFARVLTDSFKYAYVYDVIVDQVYRGKGLGKYLMDKLIDYPKLKDIKNIELTCLNEMPPFYEQFGFSKDYQPSVPMRRVNSLSTVS